MTDDPISRKIREIGWRREFTPSEQAELDGWLKSHPQARADWEAEIALSGTLGRLGDVPVSSNFTSRVLQAVDREGRPAAHGSARSGWWQGWARRTGWVMGSSFAGILLTLGLVAHHQRVVAREQELRKTIQIVGLVSALPNTEVLTNF